MSVHPDDLPPIWETATDHSSAANIALAVLMCWIVFLLMICSPALVIAVWRWAL